MVPGAFAVAKAIGVGLPLRFPKNGGPNRGRSGSSRQSRCPSRGETFERPHQCELRYGRRTLLFGMDCRFSSGIPDSGTMKPARAHRRSSREFAHLRGSLLSSTLSAHLGRHDPSLVLPKSASVILQASSSHTMESVAATKARMGTLFTWGWVGAACACWGTSTVRKDATACET